MKKKQTGQDSGHEMELICISQMGVIVQTRVPSMITNKIMIHMVVKDRVSNKAHKNDIFYCLF